MLATPTNNAVIILAGGSGARMQSVTPDKMLSSLLGKPVLAYPIEAFIKSRCVDHYFITYRDEAQKIKLQLITTQYPVQITSVQGGERRQDSVLNALRAIPESVKNVYIHDGARPLIRPESIQLLAEALKSKAGAALAHPVTDTIKQITEDGNSIDLNRETLWATETPQAFDRSSILKSYETVNTKKLTITDDVAATQINGLDAALVKNPFPNPKLTNPSDLIYLEHLLKTNL